MGARENECQISQNYIIDMKFSEFFLRFHNSFEIWHSFSQTPMRNFLWCYYRRLIISLGLEKCNKECNILQGFCPLRIKTTQFPGGFSLKINLSKEKPSLQTPLKKLEESISNCKNACWTGYLHNLKEKLLSKIGSPRSWNTTTRKKKKYCLSWQNTNS